MTSIVLEGTGKRYKITSQPFIGDLRLIKPEFGVTYRQVVDHVAEVNLDGSNYIELLDTEGFADAFLAWIWLLRLRAGERDVTADDVRQMPVDGFYFERDPGDAEPDAGDGAGGEDDEVPTSAPTDGGRGDDADDDSAAEPEPVDDKPITPSTTTSMRRSSSG